MSQLLIGGVFALLLGVASLNDSLRPSIATNDQAFAEQVLSSAVAGRPIAQVLDQLRGNGFNCRESENRVVSSSESSVRYQKHVCGPEVPALHDCARNVELGSFDGVLTHIRIALEHPDRTPNDGTTCGR